MVATEVAVDVPGELRRITRTWRRGAPAPVYRGRQSPAGYPTSRPRFVTPPEGLELHVSEPRCFIPDFTLLGSSSHRPWSKSRRRGTPAHRGRFQIEYR